MNFLLLSDLHLEYQPLDISAPLETDAVILAGDIAEGADGIRWAQATFPELPVIYVPGNHEFYGSEVGEVARAMREEAAGSNVLLLEKASTVINGIRVLGTTLWTSFSLFAGNDPEELAWSMSDCRRYVPDFDGRIRCFADGYSLALTPDITRRWHQQSAAWLAEQLATPFAGKTIVVTHHAPSARSVPVLYAQHPATPAWVSPLDDLVTQADFWVHGHMHQTYDYSIGPCRVMCNPRGYDGESKTFDAAWLFKV
jgi:predicted phosphodiesterase